MRSVEAQLEKFSELIVKISSDYEVETLAKYVHVIKPKGTQASSQERDISLTISGLIHGIEVAGLGVVVDLLEMISDKKIKLTSSLGVSLGNWSAALKKVRFVERDLNRSFGRSDRSTLEDLRADELELLFKRTKFLLDLHQVKLNCPHAFWIFPFSRTGFDFARAVGGEIPLVTHWGKGFSDDGQCSDEWVIRNGGSGASLELGQNGFDPLQIKQGLEVVVQSIHHFKLVAETSPVSPQNSPVTRAPLYTWAQVIPYPPTGFPVLDPGWSNFMSVEKGQRLGEFDGHVIAASSRGRILFPKYPDPRPDQNYGSERPAAELVRVLREISEDELPS